MQLGTPVARTGHPHAVPDRGPCLRGMTRRWLAGGARDLTPMASEIGLSVVVARMVGRQDNTTKTTTQGDQMRVLTATHDLNGNHPGDYDHCVEGELVYIQEPCATDRRDPDGPCGCGRGFAGMNSHRATTTARVVESSLSGRDLREALRSSLAAGGWLDPAYVSKQDAAAIVTDYLALMCAVAGQFPVGSVIRRRNDHFVAAGAGGGTRA